MCEFIISKLDLSSNDNNLLKDISSPILELVQAKFNEINADVKHTIDNKISNEQRKSNLLKAIYSSEAQDIYNRLTIAISTAKNKNEGLNYKISGIYLNQYGIPCVDYWLRSNPGKEIAINLIFQQLKEEGYNPRIIGISDYKSERDGSYSGGNELILTCNLDS